MENLSLSERVLDILTKTNLNWNVKEEEIQTQTGLIIPNKKALIRSDNNQILGIHGNNYQPYQNDQLCELLFQISKSTGLEIHSGGSLDDSAKVFIQLKSENLTLGDDKIEGYITGVNSFDGSTALGFGNSNITISCQNTFFKALRDVDSKVRHTINMSYKIETILKQIDSLIEDEKSTFNEIKRLNDVKITPELKDMVIRTLFQLSSVDKLDKLSTRKTNQINDFNSDLAIELAQKNDSRWGLFSGVTRYTSHTMFKTEDKSKLGKLFGKTGELERKIYNNLVTSVM